MAGWPESWRQALHADQAVGARWHGVVWLAQDTQLDEPVALKFLPPEIASDSVALNDLCRETVRSHKLTHPNIIRIHDFVQSEEAAFISMEYVDGSTLSDWRLQQPKQVLSWEQLAPLVQQLCAALEYAHGEGVIHRDLKPANLMVDKRNRLKLADFGIAAVTSDSVSRVSLPHSTSGTLPYMSPQQLTGKRPQATDDIYALGATLYELLTSKPPFYAGDVTHQVLHEPPEPMEERLGALVIDNKIPEAVAALIMACLAKEPEQRPQSARAVAEWIGLELAPKPTTESLAAALFPATKSSLVEEVASAPAGPARAAAPAGSGRNLAAVAVVVLVMAAAFWFWQGRHHAGFYNAPVTAQVTVPSSPAIPLKPAPIPAKLSYPVESVALRDEAQILTSPEPPQPRINGPSVVGARPGHPFFYHVPVTGEPPVSLAVDKLPPGLKLDAASGDITGVVDKAGEYQVHLRAKNARGHAAKVLKIVLGDTIALTPPLGWNSWNCFAGAVDDGKIRAAADAMVRSGLINHGWTYINIDDTWEGKRDDNGFIQSNRKFPDMKALADYVHAKGLKIGIYSSPGPKTFAGFEGSWQHEEKDAQQYAVWGFDYLKYDWGSYSQVDDKSLPDRARLMKPYLMMNTALRKQPRDIVFSLCQYGMGNVWEWGAEVGGNCWRTTGDIGDSWDRMSGIGFKQNGHEKWAGPGHWNDPDMMVLGKVGRDHLHPTRLTPNEQYTHVSLWCLLTAPLLIGADMSQLDPFTFNLLANDEVLAVDQDALGQQASRKAKEDETEVWAKDLADGSKAVGLFNRGEGVAEVTVKWTDLGLSGQCQVYDLWRQKDAGSFGDSFTATVPRHGVCLVRIGH